MLFNSLHFLLFLPLVVALYYLIPHRFRWMFIFIASCYFYMVFVPYYILILFAIIIIDYLAALTIERMQGKMRTFYLVLSICANVGLLAFFKYFSFLNDNLVMAFSWLGHEFHPIRLDIVLPIGLSFHTFQSMSYTIEVYRGKQKAETHLGYFANYVLFFPQMVAGPIERYDRLGEELKQERKLSYDNLVHGFRLVLFGLFVKMTIADNIAAYVDDIYSAPEECNSWQVLGAIFLFSFQIYADFYGYSTIAVGSARMLGIKIMDNFRTPYLSRSIAEFWSRWHISLSTWFRDYLYIPLGGNRVSIPRWCFNIMLVFMVSGLWHGANWTFVIWGALHGIFILREKLSPKIFDAKAEINPALHAVLAIRVFFLTSLMWVFFRAESLPKAIHIFKCAFRNFSVPTADVHFISATVAAIAMVICDLSLYRSRADQLLGSMKFQYRWAIYTILIFCLMALSGTQKLTFIYFQF
jgi:D-alanyl-lipoteichoic acid acyltransferase DltB (MBOAT superfamily)